MTLFPSKVRRLSTAGQAGSATDLAESRGPFGPSTTTVISRISTGSGHGYE